MYVALSEKDAIKFHRGWAGNLKTNPVRRRKPTRTNSSFSYSFSFRPNHGVIFQQQKSIRFKS